MTLAAFAEEFNKLSPAEQGQFTETVHKLLADGLVWREEDGDRRAYAFLVRRRDLVMDYLRVAGWELRYDERNGVFHVVDSAGTHRRRLDRETTLWLLLFRLLYAEQRESMTVTLNRYPVVTVGEISRRYAEFFPGRMVRKKTSLEEAMRALRTLKLIRAPGGAIPHVGNAEQLIELLPTLEVIVPAGEVAAIADRLREFNRSAEAAEEETS